MNIAGYCEEGLFHLQVNDTTGPNHTPKHKHSKRDVKKKTELHNEKKKIDKDTREF